MCSTPPPGLPTGTSRAPRSHHRTVFLLIDIHQRTLWDPGTRRQLLTSPRVFQYIDREDFNNLGGPVTLRLSPLNILEDRPICLIHIAKDGVFTVQVLARLESDEKLRTVGIQLPGVGHGNNPSFVVAQMGHDLVLEDSPINGLSAVPLV
eukprot:CAMPEP_0204284006 /NCGR_PEP_ID=MMETSP0468-20130131/47521_1 /ASSEMBLY_ACC=CAM_ASM_000383 /TAXON_ID=2969 /ORGANISM="Oxyrrhis marina" /LENGTH=149 /DNA_ID=CAMNT_0051261697 /DNA_START=11 /DNA_END=460 /DNA_ORIENTATION=+